MSFENVLILAVRKLRKVEGEDISLQDIQNLGFILQDILGYDKYRFDLAGDETISSELTEEIFEEWPVVPYRMGWGTDKDYEDVRIRISHIDIPEPVFAEERSALKSLLDIVELGSFAISVWSYTLYRYLNGLETEHPNVVLAS